MFSFLYLFKPVYGFLCVYFAGVKAGSREVGVIYRVGIMLGFKAETAVFRIVYTVFAVGHGVILNIITHIKLY